MLAMRAFVIIFVLLAFAVCVPAQTPQPCSDFSIDTVEKADPGTPIVVSTHTTTSNVSLRGLRFNWTTSAGTIMAGQGTSSITIDTIGLGGASITATVEVVGNQIHCSTSKTLAINAPPPMVHYDPYGDVRFSWEKDRLDNFAIQIQNQPGSRGAIITYAGKLTYKREAADRLRRAKNYLVKVRGLNPKRILTIDAGYDTEVLTYLILVPPGATVPSFESRVPIEQVQFTKGRPGSRRNH
jgi:hypothetical protein